MPFDLHRWTIETSTKAVGNFLSTKIYEFSFRCRYCPNTIKCRTDPENCDYRFSEGAVRILDTSKAKNGQFIDYDLKAAKEKNPMLKLDSLNSEFKKFEDNRPKFSKIKEIADRRNKEHYDVNADLRAKFRKEKKERAAEAIAKQAPKNFSLSLLPLNDHDRVYFQVCLFPSNL